MWQGDLQQRTDLYSFVSAVRAEAKQLWRNLESLKLGALACGSLEGPNCWSWAFGLRLTKLANAQLYWLDIIVDYTL